jgi:hypothetical protein
MLTQHKPEVTLLTEPDVSADLPRQKHWLRFSKRLGPTCNGTVYDQHRSAVVTLLLFSTNKQLTHTKVIVDIRTSTL